MSYRDDVLRIDVFHADYAAHNCIRKAAEIAARADARITELELECSQWRDELRIYRETENARIAELEQDVTELQRIKQAAELVLRWDWSDNDDDCLDDMRELSKAIDKARAGNGGGV